MSKQISFYSQVKYGLMALLSFLIAVVLLGQLIPNTKLPSNIDFISAKYEYYQARKDNYNVLFFGSSQTYNHIDPQQFDAIAHSSNLSTTSYNFGIPAMFDIEGELFLERVLANPPKNLRWVFINYDLYDGELKAGVKTPRSVYWHSLKNTRRAAEYVLGANRRWHKKVVLLWPHLLSCFYNQLNLGRLADVMVPSDLVQRDRSKLIKTQGYSAIAPPYDAELQAARALFLQSIPSYMQSVAALRTWEPEIDPETGQPLLSPHKVKLLERINEIVQAAGASPVYIEACDTVLDKPYTIAQQLNIVDTVLTYKDPNRFEWLYDVDQRFNKDHMIEAGAERFTQMLASDFVDEMINKAERLSKKQLSVNDF